ncbi:hypothetical protein NDI76_02630 [Halogeometricum sp. S1BR25-6]|uniref:Uncharacterized protein n=1 Tax=Halogeometricum salsisoli TaxID=2950536 RepID=A0ABU2GBE4_9EURY|nr:hypothetical protein [Halogeometricum sp. S1BR25-6]MDS0297634.1 hypothetical protein [Halogeometricum sp. S1BR25-6]
MSATSESSSRRLARAPRLLGPLAAWALMAVVAVLNGVFRETVLVPRIGEYVGHVLSTGLLAAAIAAVSYAFFATTDAEYARGELLAVGTGWTVLTVGFEFLVGYVEGTPVSVTLGQYDVLAGQVWILVPLTLFVTPLLFGRRFRR